MDTDSLADMRVIPLLLRASLLVLLLGSAAQADGPGPRAPRGMAGDWDEPAMRRAPDGLSPPAPAGRLSPTRRVTGGPDYVGSDYGLGKPAYFGLGSRPDWGRSSTD